MKEKSKDIMRDYYFSLIDIYEKLPYNETKKEKEDLIFSKMLEDRSWCFQYCVYFNSRINSCPSRYKNNIISIFKKHGAYYISLITETTFRYIFLQYWDDCKDDIIENVIQEKRADFAKSLLKNKNSFKYTLTQNDIDKLTPLIIMDKLL